MATFSPASDRVRNLGRALESYVIERRRFFHAHPEPSLHEHATTEAIARELAEAGIPFERPLETGVVATLRGTAPDGMTDRKKSR